MKYAEPPNTVKLWREFRRWGIGEGDTVLMHSSYRRMGKETGTKPAEFIEILSHTARNVVFPTFTYKFWEGAPWRFHTPSDTGILGETARNLPWSVRSRHPFYSVVAIGPEAKKITILTDRTSFGPGSVWRTLTDMNAQLCVLDVRFDSSFTYFHYVETSEGGVPYRFEKEFTGQVEGVEETWTMHVRQEGVRTWVEPMGELLVNVGAMRRYDYQGVDIKIGYAQDIYDAIAHYMKVIPELLYSEVNP